MLNDQIIDFDTEFVESRGIVALTSIGMVRPDGSRLYAVAPNIKSHIMWAKYLDDPWLSTHSLNPDVIYAHEPIHTRSWGELAEAITEFCGESPLFCTYVGAYDMAALFSIFGRMIDAPAHWRRTHLDLEFPMCLLGRTTESFPPMGDEHPRHNALSDALWNQRVRTALRSDAEDMATSFTDPYMRMRSAAQAALTYLDYRSTDRKNPS